MKKLTKNKRESRIEIEIFERKQQQTYAPRNQTNSNHQVEKVGKETSKSNKNTEWQRQHAWPGKGKNKQRKDSGMEDKVEGIVHANIKREKNKPDGSNQKFWDMIKPKHILRREEDKD